MAGLNMNVLARTMRIDTGRLDIPVFISLCGEDATRFTGTKKQMGKGATPQQSEASALMELMERFSFFSFIHQFPFPTFRYRDLDDFAVSAEDLKKSVHDTQTPDRIVQAVSRGSAAPVGEGLEPDARQGAVGADRLVLHHQ